MAKTAARPAPHRSRLCSPGMMHACLLPRCTSLVPCGASRKCRSCAIQGQILDVGHVPIIR